MKKIRRRKRKLMIMRIVFFGVILILAVTAVILIMKFIDHNLQNRIDDETESNQSADEQQDESASELETKLDLTNLIDPSTLNPNEKIHLDYMTDQVLPKVYYTPNTQYTTFENDNPILGSNVNTKVIIVDAGHQDDTRKSDVWLSPYLDPSKSSSWITNSLLRIGATGSVTKIPEYETTHKIAALLKTELEKLGYTVYLSHPDIKEKLSGSERSSVANKNNADLMISLHCDSYDNDSRVSGSLALIPDVWEGYPSERLSYLSKKAATIVLEEYTSATGLKNRGLSAIVKSSMFSFCKVPIFLLEMGFSTCPADDKSMNDPDFQNKMVTGIISGINKYFSLIELANSEKD